jgi:hypothetical protein
MAKKDVNKSNPWAIAPKKDELDAFKEAGSLIDDSGEQIQFPVMAPDKLKNASQQAQYPALAPMKSTIPSPQAQYPVLTPTKQPAAAPKMKNPVLNPAKPSTPKPQAQDKTTAASNMKFSVLSPAKPKTSRAQTHPPVLTPMKAAAANRKLPGMTPQEATPSSRNISSSSTLSAASSSSLSSASTAPSSVFEVSSVKPALVSAPVAKQPEYPLKPDISDLKSTFAPPPTKKSKKFVPLNIDAHHEASGSNPAAERKTKSQWGLDSKQDIVIMPKKAASSISASSTPAEKPIISFQQLASSDSEIDTMFPSITGHAKDLINRYNKDHNRCSKESKYREVKPHLLGKGNHKLTLVGTIKLHGAHADIVVNFDNSFRIQSRKQHSLSLEKDVHGVAAHLLPLRKEIIRLRDCFVARFQELNPNTFLDPRYPIVIAGEWVGPGIQPTVALTHLPQKAFVIISASINNVWVNDVDYAKIENPSVGIFNISRGKFHQVRMKIDDWEPCVEEMMRLTLEVEKECPFAKSFTGKDGKFISGIGEGIVWKAVGEGREAGSPRFWLKTKGPLHREVDVEKFPPVLTSSSDPAFSKLQAQVGADAAKQFAEATVTEERLGKGLAAVQEMCTAKGLQFDAGRTGEFMHWLVKDIETEEANEMKDRGVDAEKLKKEIGVLAKKWFKAKMKRPLEVVVVDSVTGFTINSIAIKGL